jgi:predicted GNAT family acetyltransferase
MEIINNTEASRFELRLEDGAVAFLDYVAADDGHIVYTHTEVPSQHGGKGIGTQLAQFAMEYAQTNGLRVKIECSSVERYVSKHPEYQSIVDAPAG